MPQKPEDRDYKAEYARYHGRPEQIRKRDARNAARAKVEKRNGKKKIPKGMDVDHKKSLDRGGSNDVGNLRLLSVKANRGFARDRKNNPKR